MSIVLAVGDGHRSAQYGDLATGSNNLAKHLINVPMCARSVIRPCDECITISAPSRSVEAWEANASRSSRTA